MWERKDGREWGKADYDKGRPCWKCSGFITSIVHHGRDHRTRTLSTSASQTAQDAGFPLVACGRSGTDKRKSCWKKEGDLEGSVGSSQIRAITPIRSI